MRLRDHEKEELSFYSKATTDIEYLFPFGWGELWGIADRTDYDLGRHQEASPARVLEYFDPETNERYIPYVVEPSLGADRVALAFLCEAYDEEVVDAGKNDTRVVMRLHPALAPFKACVLPLSKKLAPKAEEVLRRAGEAFHGGLRRRRLHRQALPPPGRDRHAALHHLSTLRPWATTRRPPTAV